MRHHERCRRVVAVLLRSAVKYDVMTCQHAHANSMARKASSNDAKPRRTGRPMQVYFSTEQREWIRTLAKQRHVTDSGVVRVAVDLLMRRLADGELDPPLGLINE